MSHGIYSDFLPSLYAIWEYVIQEVAWEFCLKQQLQPVTPSASHKQKKPLHDNVKGPLDTLKVSHEADAPARWF